MDRPHQALDYLTPEQVYTGQTKEALDKRRKGKNAARKKRRKYNQEVA
nr:hypothetical protein [Pullulanibacillus camelliae]